MGESDQIHRSLMGLGGGFEIVVADPPWDFASNSKQKPGKNPRRHYPTLNLSVIEGMPIKEIVSRNALLFLWTTSPYLGLSWPVLEAWGFRYKTNLCWRKNRVGTGFWARNRHELCLIARRGRFPCPRPAPFPDSVIDAPVRQHSRKPDELQDRIDELWPDARKLELFARRDRPGWVCWGNETGKFDPDTDPSLEDILS